MKKLLLAICLLFTITTYAQVERIEVLDVYKNPNGYLEIQSVFRAKVPTRLSDLQDFQDNARSIYSIDSLVTIEGSMYAVYCLRISMSMNLVVNGLTTMQLTTPADIRNRMVEELDRLESNLNSLVPLPIGNLKNQLYIDSTWVDQ